MTPATIGRVSIGFFAGAAIVITMLVYQHVHHGWPFSLHHGQAPIPPQASRAVPREGGASHAGHRVAVRVESEQLGRFGIRTEPVSSRPLVAELRTVATVVPDETRIAHVHTRVAGWIERLDARATGEPVRAGETLAAIFSQELLASQTEYLAVRRAAQTGHESPLVEGARERLRVLGMTDSAIAALERRGTTARTVAIVAPRTGVITHRGVTVGQSVDPSTELFTIVDLTRVWILAEVPEARAPDVNVGTRATLDLPASGRERFEAEVQFVYPTLTERTRTLRVRFVAENSDGRVRPGMFGTATFHIAPRTVLAVSRDSVVDTGISQHVFVERSAGYFEPRVVRLGARTESSVEILEGLDPGDRVVTSGVFLLDSESRLRATGTPSGHAGHEGVSPSREPSGPAEGDTMPSEPDSREGHPAAGHEGHGD